MEVFIKDPGAKLDFSVDWEPWLKSVTDTISDVTPPVWTVPTGLTKHQESNTTYKTTVWLSGGTLGVTYSVVNRITTTAGRIDERTLRILITDR